MHLEDRLHQYMVGGSTLGSTGHGSEENWISNDNRYALDRNGIHYGRGYGCVGVGTGGGGGFGSLGGRLGGRGGAAQVDSGTGGIEMSDPISRGASNSDKKKAGNGDESSNGSFSRIFEGSNVNIDVTSAGATLALGLMYKNK